MPAKVRTFVNGELQKSKRDRKLRPYHEVTIAIDLPSPCFYRDIFPAGFVIVLPLRDSGKMRCTELVKCLAITKRDLDLPQVEKLGHKSLHRMPEHGQQSSFVVLVEQVLDDL